VASPLFKYQPIVEVGPDLYCVDGEWEDTLFKRRMTIFRLSSGNLVIHSAIHLSDGDFEKLDALGKVTWIVVPNRFHLSDAPVYAERYPDAKVISCKPAIKHLQPLCHVHGLLPDDWPAPVRKEIDIMELSGMRILGECVFIHHPSKTLVVTDLIFNMGGDHKGVSKIFLKLNQIFNRPSLSRIGRLVFVQNKKAFLDSIEKMMNWDFEQIVMSHGNIIYTHGKEAMKEALKHVKS
jgi:hypothetical protein